MRRTSMMVAALALAGCGKGTGSQTAQQHASDITNAQVAASGGVPGTDVRIKGYDAKGCKDKAQALELIAAAKSDPTGKFIKLMAEGMKNEACRGFADGLPVKIAQTDGDLSCILPGDDPQNKQCFWVESSSF